MILKSEGGMREKNIHSTEGYIGKKYKVLYYSKYDYMVIEQEYKKALHGAIMMAVICGATVTMLILIVLGDMGYLK